jgi:nitrogenase molybdenum-cofactor synthesis protein NifE
VKRYRADLCGKRAAIYVGGSFKAFSLVKALRHIGIHTSIVGSQTGNSEDYEYLKEICDEGTIIVDDTNPLELSRFMTEKNIHLLIGGVKERPIAYKMGVAFCDHNHERKVALAGFEGMLNFCREVYSSMMSPVWEFSPARRKDASFGRKNENGNKRIAA